MGKNTPNMPSGGREELTEEARRRGEQLRDDVQQTGQKAGQKTAEKGRQAGESIRDKATGMRDKRGNQPSQ
ncbi:hypothetical protein [Allorhizocola rhizosphaerae]|uniref:hypothetical protein n=1 Tax=Allorhizocola rhizosphaerae TaxID=1872709 RepID=UPI0013C300ED|nr:hypothetical protein [Allorhizocola rhizosphaerae]